MLTRVVKFPLAGHSMAGGGGVVHIQIQLGLVPNPGPILLQQIAFGGNVSTTLTNFSLN